MCICLYIYTYIYVYIYIIVAHLDSEAVEVRADRGGRRVGVGALVRRRLGNMHLRCVVEI